MENRCDGPESRRRELGTLEDDRITTSKRLEASSETKYVGGIPAKQSVNTPYSSTKCLVLPWRNAKYNAIRLLVHHRT